MSSTSVRPQIRLADARWMHSYDSAGNLIRRRPGKRHRGQLPPASEYYELRPSLAQQEQTMGAIVVELGQGLLSGRNLFALFADDATFEPRLKYSVRIESGNPEYPHLRDTREPIPASTSFREMVQNYPQHVYGDGLRMFIAEDNIWNVNRWFYFLPAEMRAKYNPSDKRKHNGFKAKMSRELKRMTDEEQEMLASAQLDHSDEAEYEDEFSEVGERSEEGETDELE